MKNIDIIIKYLSGDLMPDESDKFKKNMSEDPVLQNEFESISSIWIEIQKQLQLNDGPESENREQLIAEILSEHDIHLYGIKAETEREFAFKKTLSQSMKESSDKLKPVRKISPRVYSMISLMAAAMIAVLVIILNPAPDINELSKAYYQPASDPVFEKLSETTRSDLGSAMAFFKQGDYMAARTLALEELKKHPYLEEISLLLSLAYYESGEFSQAESQLLSLIEGASEELGNASIWYLSLLYLQNSDTGKAKAYLEILDAEDGPYQKRAGKLLKLIK